MSPLARDCRRRWHRQLLVLSVPCVVLPAWAAGGDCEPVREVHPLAGEALPADGSIWEICYYGSPDSPAANPEGVCSAPRLRDARGGAVELLVERRAEAPPTRWVTRYRPAAELEVGATYTLEPGAFARPGDARSVRIVAASDALPPPPVLEKVDYWVMGTEAEARIRFGAFQGMLVKDVGAQGSPALGAVDVSHVGWDGDARPTLLLAQNDCVSNFAAEPGASANIRFGVLDLAGRFSGWGEPHALSFPTGDTGAAPAGAGDAGEPSADEGCALTAGSAPASRRAGALLLALGVLGLRRARR